MVIQFTLLVAVQEQPLAVATATVPWAPPAGTDTLAGAIEYEQAGAPPAWVRVNVWPAMVSVPVREEVPVLVATE